MKGTLWTAAACAALAGSMLFGSMLVAQQPAATSTAHGHVQNAAQQPLAGAKLEFTKDKTTPYKDAKMLTSAVTDGAGNYKVEGLTPGDYFIYVTKDGKAVDQLEVTVKANVPDYTFDDDQSRPEYIAKMTPEEKKQLEEFKAKNAEIMKSNSTIANLNNTLKQVRADLTAAQPTAADVSKDVSDMKQATDQKPDESLLWITYGDALTAQGDHLAKSDKAAGKAPQTDPDVTKMYDDAAAAYKTGVDKDLASKKPIPAQQAAGYGQMGNALAKEGKVSDAATAYEAAAKADPTKAGMYYSNEAIVMLNNSQSDAAIAAADKAIAADPNRPEPYYIKGQVLIQKSTLDPKTQKLVAPPGCVEAYQKYLELAPDGKFAPTVKEVLDSLGEKQSTKYSSGKKK
jgi:tetratricopeptide (TPR) repeat protein